MAEQIYQIIGERIKILRKKKKMSQHELSSFCNLKRASLSQIESGKQKVSIANIYKISNALSCEIFDLLPASNNNEIDIITSIRFDEISINKATSKINKLIGES